MRTYDFTISGNSLIMSRTPTDNDVKEKTISFRSPSLMEANGRIKLFEAGKFQTSLIFEDFGLIDGEAPSDIIDAKDKLLVLFGNFNGGGGTPQIISSNEELGRAGRKGDTLYGILDQYTGEEITLTLTEDTNDSDNIIYFELGSEKFKRNFTFLRPEWFGLDGVNDEVAINKALALYETESNNSLVNTSIIVKGTPNHTYITSAPIVMSKGAILDFNGSYVNSTTTGTIIKGRDELLTILYQHINCHIINPVLRSSTATKGIDLMGFVHSSVINPDIRLLTTDSIGIDLRHGANGYEYCYFNKIENPKIYLDDGGTGIWIRGVDGVSGANSNSIYGGAISGYDDVGIKITELSTANAIYNTDCEAYGGGNPDRIGFDIEGTLNTLVSVRTENYDTCFKVRGTSNKILNPTVAAYTTVYDNIGNNMFEGGNSDGGVAQSIGRDNEVGLNTKHVIAGENLAGYRIDSLNSDLASRNYWLGANFLGDGFLFRKSTIKGADPLISGFNFLELTSANVLLSEVKNKIQAVAGTSLEVVGEGGAQEVTQTKSLSGSFGVNAFYGDFGVKGAMWFGQYKDGKGIIWNNGAFPIGFFINGVENFTMNVGGTTTFNFNVIVPNATSDTHAINRGQANGLYQAKIFNEYVATIEQNTTSNPTATIVDNKLSGAITWVRNSVGEYDGTLTGAFTPALALNISPALGFIEITKQSNDVVRIKTYNNLGVLADDILKGNTISIRVKI